MADAASGWSVSITSETAGSGGAGGAMRMAASASASSAPCSRIAMPAGRKRAASRPHGAEACQRAGSLINDRAWRKLHLLARTREAFTTLCFLTGD
jgi:hypothetical protein